MTVVTHNMGLAYPKIISDVVEHGDLSSPRGMAIREQRGFHLVLTDPTRPLVERPNFGKAIMWADIASVVSGTFINTVYDIASSAETRSLHKASGAYGPRTYGQVTNVIAELRRDPDSRRAVVYVGRETDLWNSQDTGEMPCTSLWQFFVRDGALEMITYMRSWDLVWGLSYDLPVFTTMQRFIAQQLGLQLGNYQHFAGSAHVYERHWNLTNLKEVETPALSLITPGPNDIDGLDHDTARKSVALMLNVFAALANAPQLDQSIMDTARWAIVPSALEAFNVLVAKSARLR